jgi:hypothetical protein
VHVARLAVLSPRQVVVRERLRRGAGLGLLREGLLRTGRRRCCAPTTSGATIIAAGATAKQQPGTIFRYTRNDEL